MKKKFDKYLKKKLLENKIFTYFAKNKQKINAPPPNYIF